MKKLIADNPSQTEINFPKSQIIDDQNSYSVSYDLASKNPKWTLEIFKKGEKSRNSTPSQIEFFTPTNFLEEVKILPEDYNHQDFTIGPLLANSISPYPIIAASPHSFKISFSEWQKLSGIILFIDNIRFYLGGI